MTKKAATNKSAFIANGCYPTRGGYLRIAEMIPSHLVNAYLKALANDEPYADALAVWIDRRGLAGDAFEEALRRTLKPMLWELRKSLNRRNEPATIYV